MNIRFLISTVTVLVSAQVLFAAPKTHTLQSPDGRLAGEPFCDNASPMMGRDVSGPTATVKSVASMGQGDFHDGALFNLRFDPKGVEGEKGIDSIEGVIKTYFKHGGEHIQINVVDDKTLKAAQKNPEHYKGLMVRVAGYMAYFTELDKSAQDTIIYRTTHFKQAEAEDERYKGPQNCPGRQHTEIFHRGWTRHTDYGVLQGMSPGVSVVP